MDLESGGSLSDKPSLPAGLCPSILLQQAWGEGEWLSAQTQLEMLGVKRIRCPAPELCCADPEKGQSSAYKAKELGTRLQKPPVPRPITDQLCHLEQATHRAQ